ncbi:hypothetical protein [Terrabacter lapilli]|uniref:hypothetical protein n=1 Tax=Terrabacter lapilli TaxID=436231 RepID=UPI0031D86999
MDPAPLPEDLATRPFTAAAALARGVTRRRLRAQDLWTPTRGVRTVELPTTVLERARAFAAVAPTEFAFSHVTAAQLLGIPLPYAVEDDCLVHIVSPTAANRMRRPEVRGHRGLEGREVVEVDGLPVVSPADTWADLGEFVGPGRPVGLDDLIAAGDAVANLVGGTWPLRRAVERRVRPRGKVTLTYAIPRIRLGAWSAMETRSRLMVVRAGLPEPQHNIDVVSHAGRWLGCGDLVWEEQRVVGEYQGAEFHTRLKDRARDGVRRDGIERGDWTVVEIVAADVFDRQCRAAKLRELAGHLGVSAHLLDVLAADPQFLAPAQFARPRRRRA